MKKLSSYLGRKCKKNFSFFKDKTYYYSTSSMHVDAKDNKFFEKVKDWWDPNGSMYTLHYYNDLRIKYLKRELNKEGIIEKKNINSAMPFANLKFMDVGCGAGLFCESLARLGGFVVGIDSNANSFEIASGHLDSYEGSESEYMKSKLNYFWGSIDNYASKNSDKKFDIITAMEVIEHVNSPQTFIADISPFVKPGGYILMSTINKTQISYLKAILLGEKITGIIPNGTHDWNKFISPEDLAKILNHNGFSVRNISGVNFNIITHNMSLIDDTSVNYILIARKL